MIRVLVSNTIISSTRVGSWTNRISRFIEKENLFFDFIFSPSPIKDSRNLYCKKRKWIPFFSDKFRNWQLLNYRIKHYIDGFKNLPKDGKIQVVVMDDLILLEGFALLKAKGEKFELVFSYHGHSLSLVWEWSVYVDKVLFLTNLGYLDTLHRHHEFTPLVSVIGNGVNSLDFFPLDKFQKEERKRGLGVPDQSKILIWLSNNRPKKGFHLFKVIAKRILEKYPDLLIWVIGVTEDHELLHERIKFHGKIPNTQLPQYLQAGDFYMFTSLWKEGFGLTMLEAAKCGNQIIASRMGGIPEVVEGLEGVYLIDYPNRPEFWIEAFENAWKNSYEFVPDGDFLKNFHDLDEWMSKFKNALIS